jgi:hypothetical protein
MNGASGGCIHKEGGGDSDNAKLSRGGARCSPQENHIRSSSLFTLFMSLISVLYYIQSYLFQYVV